MNVVSIPLDLIDVGERLREVDPDYAELLAASIAVDGLRSAIEVRPSEVAGRFVLVAGAHRLAAVRAAGLHEIPAVTLTLDDLTAKRLEIEENLLRHDLTELDRSVFLARWKELYELLHPRFRHGGKRTREQVAKLGHLNAALRGEVAEGAPARFTALAADKFRASERSVRRAVLRFSRIAPDVRKQIAGTWLANRGSELDALARLRPAVQREVAAILVKPIIERTGREPDLRTVRAAAGHVMGVRDGVASPDQVQCDALLRLWRRTGTAARRAFAAELAKDGPWTLMEDA